MSGERAKQREGAARPLGQDRTVGLASMPDRVDFERGDSAG